MNIDLKYKNNSYNFQLRKDVSIKYIENIASKLISKDKSSFDLLYNNNILSENSNYLLKDIIQTDKIISIVISPKLEKNMERKLPKISLSKIYSKNIKNYNSDNSKFITNENGISLSLNNKLNKDLLKYFLYKDSKKKKVAEKKYHIKNEVFEEVYDNKENELLILMKDLSEKIKEFDDILYAKYKSDNKNMQNNRELLVFEKNIIDFKNWQIQYIRKLINYLEDRNDLKEFYLELKTSSNIKNRFRRNEKMEQSKLYSITQENAVESQNKDDIFPLLSNNSDSKPYLTINKKEKINRNENVNEKEQIDDKPILIYEKQERNINDKLNFQEMKKNKSLDKEKTNIFKNKDQVRNKDIIKTKSTPNQMSVIESQKNKKNINILKYLDNDNENNLIKNRIDNNEINEENEENYKFNNSINNRSIYNKNNKNTINTEETDINNDNNYYKNFSLNDHIKFERLNLLTESINYDNKKLYSSLDINEPNHIKNKSNISSLVDRSLENESGNIEKKDKILNREKILDLGNKEEKSVINRYKQKSRLRKLNKRNKKLGRNEMDFLI